MIFFFWLSESCVTRRVVALHLTLSQSLQQSDDIPSSSNHEERTSSSYPTSLADAKKLLISNRAILSVSKHALYPCNWIKAMPIHNDNFIKSIFIINSNCKRNTHKIYLSIVALLNFFWFSSKYMTYIYNGNFVQNENFAHFHVPCQWENMHWLKKVSERILPVDTCYLLVK